jgi:hypothetical protein
LLISAWAFVRIIGFIVIWRWSGWHYSVRWLIGTFVALIGSFVLVLALPEYISLLMVAQMVFGLCTALVYSASLYYAMHVSSGSGGHAGAHEALIGIGVTIGPAVGAIAGAGDTTGRISPSTIIAVTGVLGVGLVLLVVLGCRAGAKPGVVADA